MELLQRNVPLTTSQVRDRLAARGYGVTVRTIQPDLENLAKHFPLDCDERTKPFGWRWRPGAPQVTLPGMDWPQALSFHLLGTYLQGVMPGSVLASIRPYLDEAQRVEERRHDQRRG